MSVASPSASSLLLEALLRRGLAETVRSALDERGYDRARGIETRRRVPVSALVPPGSRAAWAASEYQPVPVRLFRAAIAHVPSRARERPFVDLGCGKGRALVLAAEAGFRRLRGIELSPELAAVAQANLDATAARLSRSFEVEIRAADADDHRFADDEGTIFLFHPFAARVLRAITRRLIESLDAHPRPVSVVYVNPLHGGVLAESPCFREVAVGRTRIPGTLDWAVFEASG